MTAETTSVILGAVKKDHRSGKERLCCRCIQTELKIHIACLISRARLCRPQCMRKGLFVYAFIRPDQVDVWDREPLCEPRDNQIDRSDWCWDCRLSEMTSGFFYAWKQEEYIAPSYNGQYTGLSLRRRGFDSRWGCWEWGVKGARCVRDAEERFESDIFNLEAKTGHLQQKQITAHMIQKSCSE